MKRLFIIIFFIIVSYNVTLAISYVPVNSYIYPLLEYLEAKGCINSGILTTYPLSNEEVERLIHQAKNNCANKEDPYLQESMKLINRFLSSYQNEEFLPYWKPVKNFWITYAYSNSVLSRTYTFNNQGDEYGKGSNVRLGITTEIGYKNVSLVLSPELRQGREFEGVYLKEGYLVYNWKNLNFLIGKQSMWWGPGRGGSIILSDNAPGFTMIRVENNYPYVLRWLGLFKFSFFVTRLGENRVVPHPYLWGLRLNIKPCPFFELGLSRTALLGGKGRSTTLSTWIKSFLAKDENTPKEPGDQRAGFDVKVNVPNKYLPFQTYLEAEGEDEAGNLPEKWAYIWGFYVPQLYKLPFLSLRVEFAGTDRAWYIHHIYKSGYTYDGKIIGYYIGRDARSFLLSLGYWWLKQKIRLNVIGIRVKHHINDQEDRIYKIKFQKFWFLNCTIYGEIDYFKTTKYLGTSQNKNFWIGIIGLKVSF